MCDLCHYYNCPSGCPNADPPPIFAYCKDCGAEIYDGDEYYEIGDDNYCEACVRGCMRIADVEAL